MEKNEKTEQLKKRRKFLLAIPLLVLPFVTLAFWALGGGQGKTDAAAIKQAGINNNLPKAKLKQSPLDKMSLYAQADADSAELKNEAGTFNYPVGDSAANGYTLKDTTNAGKFNHIKSNGMQYGFEEDPNEVKVQQKLSELQSAIDHSAQQAQPVTTGVPQIDPSTYGLQPGEQDLERLKGLMATAQDNGGDSDMKQINAMLNKIMDIQHPERIDAQLKAQSAKDRGRVFAVERPPDELNASLLSSPVSVAGPLPDSGVTQQPVQQYARNAFYDIDATGNTDDNSHLTIPAVIAQTQTLITGESIKMRLSQDVYINGTLIPKNNFVYGICTVSGERLKISVQSIRYGNSLFPVNLSAYDLDAIEGIRIPDAISRDASKEGADRAIQSIQMMSLDPNIGTQAAAAGIEATKSLLSKKIRLVRVTVKADYPLLLMDTKGLQEER